MKKYFAIMIGLLIFSSCKDDKAEDVKEETETPLFKSGQIVTSEIRVGDRVIETMKDSIVNFGSEEDPALFYVNLEHKINGEDVENGNSENNGFRSLTKADIQKFIHLWAYLYNLDTSDLYELRAAYNRLEKYLLTKKIDLAVLISLSNSKEELESTVTMVNALSNVDTKSTSNQVSANDLLLTLEKLNLKSSTVLNALSQVGISPEEFMKKVSSDGIDLNATLKSNAVTKATPEKIIAAIFKGITYVDNVIVKFIDSGQPKVNFENVYISFLNKDKQSTYNYAGSIYQRSEDYSVSYCTLAKASFYISTYYGAIHSEISGKYIPRVSFCVKSVTCSGGMHVNGKANFDSDSRESDQGPIAYCDGSVEIDYGDIWCFRRHAYLKFNVDAENGYKQISWTPKKK